MNDKTTKSDAPAKEATSKKVAKAPGKNAVDPMATAPSKDPDQEARKEEATATEPNSRERVGLKQASRTGRGNGGDGEAAGYARPGLNTDLTPDTLGEREEVSPATTDVIWTNASKDRWGVDQPNLSDLLKQRTEVEEQRQKRER